MLRPAQRRLILISAAFALSLLSCGREVTGPENGIPYGNRVGNLALAPRMPSLMEVIEGAGDAVPFTKVRVLLRNESGSVVKDTVVDFPASEDSIALTLQLPIPLTAPDSGYPLSLTMAYINATGDTVFRGGPNAIVARPLGDPAAGTPVVIPITYEGTGKDADSVVIAPVSGIGVAGTTRAFTATAFGAGAPIANTPFLFYTLDSTRASVNGATGVVTWLPLRGTARIVAALPNGLRADTASFTVSLPASKLVLGSGDAQTGAVLAPLADSIVVRALASDDVPVAGVIVTFAVASGGGTLAVLTDTSDALGEVKTAWTLGSALGTQGITASAAGLTGSPLSITATAVAATPTRLEIVSQPATVTAGAGFAPPIVVAARDAFGNLATTFTGEISLAINGPNPPPFGGATARNAVGGLATFDAIDIKVAGTYELRANSGTLVADTTAPITVAAAAAARLAFSQQPVGAVAGAELLPPITVSAADAYGNPASDFTGPVTLTLLNAGGATLRGTLTQNAVAGVATFTGLDIREVGTAYRLAATSGTLAADTSATFGITPSSPAQLAITGGNAQSASIGGSLADSLEVEVKDLYNNLVAGATVHFTVVSGGGTLSTASAVTDSTGRARTAWTLGNTLGAQQVDASLAAAPAVTVSFGATASVGAPAQVVITAAPTTVTAGTAFTVTAEVRDAEGNVIPTYVGQMTVALDANPSGATLGGTVLVTATGGVGTFNTLQLTAAAAGYTLRVSAPSDTLQSAPSAAITVNAAGAAQFFSFSGNDQTVVAGSAFPAPLQVRVLDVFNNPMIGHPTTWSENGVVTLGTVGTVLTDSNGVATNTAIAGATIGAQSGGPSVSTLGQGSVVIFSHTVTAGAPTSIVFTQQPDSVVAGEPFPPTLWIEIRDALGNRATSFNDSVTISVDSGPAGGVVLGPVTQFITVGGGPAGQFAGLEIEVAGTYRLRAAAPGGLTGVSGPLVVVPNGFRQFILVSGANDTAAVNQPFAAPLRVRVTDSYGNPVQGNKVWFVDEGGGATVAADTVFTDADGYAETTATHGPNPATLSAITAFTSGTADSRTFWYTTTAGSASQLSIITQAAAGQVAGVALTDIVVRVEDAGGNPTSYADTLRLAILSGPLGASIIGGDTLATVLGSSATFSGIVLNKAGIYALEVTGPGVSKRQHPLIVVAAGAADSVTVVAGDAQSVAVTDTSAAALVVAVRDQFGNAVSGATVSFDIPLGAVTLTEYAAVTDSLGQASTRVVAGGSIGAFSIVATVAGVADSAEFSGSVTAGDASVVNEINGPVSGTAGSALPAFSYGVYDGFGNLATGYNGTAFVIVEKASVEQPTPVVTGGDTVSVVNGVATWNALTITSAGLFRVTVDFGPVLGTIVSSNFSVDPAGPALLVKVAGDSQSVVVGNFLPAPLEARVTDAYGNGVGGVNVNFNIVSGVATLTQTTVATDAAGVASVSVAVDSTAGAIVIGAFAAGLTPDSLLYHATGLVGAASGFSLVAGDLQTVAAGAAASDTVRVRLKDAYGNAVIGASVTFGTFDDLAFTDTLVTTDANGVASTVVIAGSSIGIKNFFASSPPATDFYLTLDVQAAAAATLDVTSSVTSGTAGLALDAITVTLRDAFGNAALTATDSVFIAVDSGPAGGTLGGVTRVAASGGVATFASLVITQSGGYRLRVTGAGLADDTTSIIDIAPDTAAFLTYVSGTAQTLTPGADAADSLVVRVTDVYGNPVPNALVSWGVSVGTATLSTSADLTDADGYSRVLLTASSAAESGQVTAANGAWTGSPVTFTYSTAAGAATALVFSVAPTNATAGDILSSIVVVARDAFGNVASGFTDSVTLTVETGPATPTITGALTVAAVGGVATFSGISIETAGAYVLRAAAAGVTDTVSSAFTIAVGAPAALTLVDGDAQSAPVGTILPSHLRVRLTDVFGNPIEFELVSWTVLSGDISLGASSSSTDATGEATVGVVLGATAGAFSVRGVNAAANDTVIFTGTADPDVASALVVTAQPDTMTSGTTSGSFTVEARDVYGNLVTSFIGNVSAEIVFGPDSVFTGGTLTRAAVGGVVVFNDLVLGTAGSYQLRFLASFDTVSTTNVEVTAGAAAALSVLTSPSVAEAGLALDTLRIEVRDAAGNRVGSFAPSISIAVDSGPVGGTLSGTTIATVGGDSIARFGNLVLTVAGTYRLRASATGVASVDLPLFTVAPSLPDTTVLLDGDAQTLVAGAALPNPLRVVVRDAYGNPVSGRNVSWTAISGSMALDSTETTTDSAGIAAMTLSSTGSTGALSIQADGPAGSPVVFGATVTAAAPAQLVMDLQPVGATAGSELPDFSVTIRDAFNNLVATATDSVTVSFAVSPLTPTVLGTLTRAATAGVATFDDITFNTAGGYRLQFNAAGLTAVISDSIYISAAAADSMFAAAGDGQSAVVLSTLDTLSVRVVDAFGNPVAGQNVNWQSFSDATVLYEENTTDAEGLVRAVVQLSSNAVLDSVRASAELIAGSPVAFSFTGLGGTAVELAVLSTPDTLQSLTIGAPIVIEARDTYGNRATSFADSVFVSVNDGPASIAVGDTAAVAVAGLASFGNLQFGVTGNYTLQFTSGGLSAVNRTVYVRAGAAATFTLVSGDGQSGFSTLPLDTAFTVLVRDAANNPVPSDTVIWSVLAGSGGGLVNGGDVDTVLTDINGYASATFTAGSTIGTQTARATASYGATLDFTVSVTALIGNSVWTGNANTDWTNSANWLGGVVPTALDSVLVLGGRPNYPVLTGDVGMTKLYIEDGVLGITLGDHNVLVTGSIRAPQTAALSRNLGTVQALGSGPHSVQGTLPYLIVENGDYAVAGGTALPLTVTSDVLVQGGGRLTLDAGDSVYVWGSFTTATGGQLAQAADALLEVQGDAQFAGGSTAGLLTGGRLRVSGNFSTSGAEAAAFQADATHELQFNGGVQSITLAAPDLAPNASCTATCLGLVIADSVTGSDSLRFFSGVKARGGFSIENRGVLADGRVVVAGAASTLRGDTVRIGTLVFVDDYPDFATATVLDSIVAAGTGALPPSLTIPTRIVGDFGISSTHGVDLIVEGSLDVTSPSAAVNGSLRTQAGGRLVMGDADDTLRVYGPAYFYGSSSPGDLSNGTLMVFGNFDAGSGGFVADPAHVTALTGSVGGQVGMSNSGFGAGQSRFGSLLLAKGEAASATTTPISVDGQLITADDNQVLVGPGTANVLTIRGANLVRLRLINQPLVLADGAAVTRLDSLQFESFSEASVTQFLIVRDSMEVPLVSPVFDSTATTPTYLELVDATTGPESLTVTVVDPRPLFHLGRIVIGSRASLLGWEDFEAFNWTNGGGDAEWTNPGNWDTGVPPSAGDSVFIANVGNAPIISSPVTVKSLVSDHGLTITLSSELVVRNQFNLPVEWTAISCGTTGTVVTDAGYSDSVLVRGNLDCGLFPRYGRAQLSGSLTVDSLIADSTGAIALRDNLQLIVQGPMRFLDGSAAFLEMTHEAASVRVEGDVEFFGAAPYAALTGGTLRLSGNFVQGGSSASAFQASSGHTTRFVGSVPQSISFSLPDSSAAGAHFSNLVIGTDGTDVTLLSDVYSIGELSNGEGTTALVGGGDVRTLTTIGADLGVGTFTDVLLRITDAASIVQLSGITFSGLGGQGTQLHIYGTAGTPSISSVAFDTLDLVGGDLFLAVTDTDGGSDLTVSLSNIVPQFHGGRIALFGGATLSGWLEEALFVWTGAVSTDWNTAANWSSGVVPSASDSVHIPSGFTQAPVISNGTVNIRALVSADADSSIYIASDGLLQITELARFTGNGVGVSCANGDEFHLTNFASIGGRIGGCDVRAVGGWITPVDSLIVAGNLVLANDAVFDMNAATVRISGELSVTGTSSLLMDSDEDSLLVDGMATFQDGTVPQLSAGVLRVLGDFNQQGTGSFQATGTHVTQLGDTCTFDCGARFVNVADTARTGTFFRHLTLLNGQREMYVPLTVTGTLRFETETFLYSDKEAIVGGDIEGSMNGELDVPRLRFSGAYTFAGTNGADTVEFAGANQAIPAQVAGNPVRWPFVYVTGSAYALTNGLVTDVVQIDSGLTVQSGGTLTVGDAGGARVLYVGSASDLSGFQTLTGGRLVMQHPGAEMLVYGVANFAGGDETGLLTNGLLRVESGFSGSGVNEFVASGAHRTRLGGNGLIEFFEATDDNGDLKFATLELHPQQHQVPTSISADTLLQSDGGQLVMAEVGTALRVSGDYSASTTASLEVALLEVGGRLLSNATLTVDTVRLVGAGQPLRAFGDSGVRLDYQRVEVAGSARVDVPTGDSVIIGGELMILNGGSLQFDNLGGTTAITRVAGDFATVGSGTISMLHSPTRVRLFGDAVFEGGSTAGLLRAGTLELHGGFVQLSTNSTSSFQADSSHFAEFQLGESTANIEFDTPGYGAGDSRFAFFQVQAATPGASAMLTNDVYAGNALLSSTADAVELRSPETELYTVHARGMQADRVGFLRTHLAIVDGYNFVEADSLHFSLSDPNGTPLSIARAGGTYDIDTLVFETLPITGKYLRLEDTNENLDTLTLNVTLPVPGYYGVNVELIGEAVLNGWFGSGPAFWTGATSSNFDLPSNWLANVVPSATDSVTIPLTATGSIDIAGSRTIGALVHYGSAAILNISGTLTVSGAFNAKANGLSCSGGAIVLDNQSGTPRNLSLSSGNCDLTIAAGEYQLDSTTLARNVELTNDATLTLNGYRFANLNFSVQDSAALVMQNAADTLRTSGDASFGGRNTAGLLTAGSVEVFGDFSNGGSHTGSFVASPGQRLVLGDSTGASEPRSLTFSTADSSQIHSLLIANGEYQLTGDLKVNGAMALRANTALDSGLVVADSGLSLGIAAEMRISRLAIRGNFLPGSGFSADTVDFYGPTGAAPYQAVPPVSGGYKLMRVYGSTRVINMAPANVVVNEALEIHSGMLNVQSTEGVGLINLVGDSADLIVTGDGELGMLTAGTVSFDSAHFAGGIGAMKAGTLRINRALVQRNVISAQSFAPDSGAHVTEFTDSVRVDFENPGSSWFRSLRIGANAHLELYSDVTVLDTLMRPSFTAGTPSIRADSVNVVAPRVLTVHGGTDFSTGSGYKLNFRNVSVRVESDGPGGSFNMAGWRFTDMHPEAAFLDLLLFTNKSTVIADSIDFVSPVTTGQYFRLGSGTTMYFQNSTPQVGCISDSAGCAGPRFEPDGNVAVNTWTGAISTNWNVAGNWSLSRVPTGFDDVFIDSLPPNQPVISSPARARNLTVDEGGFIDIGDTLDIRGSASFSAFTFQSSGGLIRMRPDAAAVTLSQLAEATFETPIEIAQGGAANPTVSLGSYFYSSGGGNDFTVRYGRFDPAGNTLELGGRFATANSGALVMDGAADSLHVGSLLFSGGSTTGLLTDGGIFYSGSFVQAAGAADAFAAGPGHRVTANVVTTDSVHFANPGPDGASSRFGSFTGYVVSPGNDEIRFRTPVVVAGTLTVSPTAVLRLLAADTLDVLGSVDVQGYVTGADYTSALRMMTPTAGASLRAPGSIAVPLVLAAGLGGSEGRVTLNGQVNLDTLASGFDGFRHGLHQRAGVLDINGQTLRSHGGLRIGGTGILEMDQPSDSVYAVWNVVFAGPSTDGYLTDGKLVAVGGGFQQAATVSVNSFVATGNHQTIFGDGSTGIDVDFESSSPTGSRFAGVRFAKTQYDVNLLGPSNDSIYAQTLLGISSPVYVFDNSLIVLGAVTGPTTGTWYMQGDGVVDLQGVNQTTCDGLSYTVEGAAAQFLPTTCHTTPFVFSQANGSFSESLRGVFALDDTTAWAVGDNGAIYFLNDATDSTATWTAQTSGVSVTLRAVHAVSPTEAWAVGASGTILRWDGSSWSQDPSPTLENLRAIYMYSATSGFAVGDESTILQWDGAEWAPVIHSISAYFYGIFDSDGAGPNRLRVVGDGGTVAYLNAGSWVAETNSASAKLNAIWEDAGSLDRWAVGDGHFVRNSFGVSTTWFASDAPGIDNLFGISGLGNVTFAVGGAGTIVRRLGTQFRSQASPTAEDLLGISVAPSGVAFVVGTNGTLLRGIEAP